MSSLVDSNVWVALAFERHVHHATARTWLETVEDSTPACFSRMTQNSFLRLVTSGRFFKEEALSNRAAQTAYRRLRGDSRIGWVEESSGVEELWWAFAARDRPAPRVWMDAYLAAFATCAGLRFVTLDGDFKKYEKDGLELLLLGGS